MQRAPQRRERGFVEGLAQGRVRVDGEGYVLETRAHFQRQRKGRRELRDPGADRVDSEHDMVVRAGCDAHEALVVLNGHRATVGAEREMADADFAMRGLGRVGRKPHRDNLGVGEADRRNRLVVEGAPRAGNDLGEHLALRHRAVGEHRFTRYVADRPDVAHRGRASLVDAHERAAHRKIERLEPEAVCARAPADRDQDLVGPNRALQTVRAHDLERALDVPKSPGAHKRLDAKIGQAPRDRLGQLRIVVRQDLGQRLNDRHLGAELGECHAELHPDIARADHGERSRNLGQGQRVRRRQDVAAELERRQFHRRRAGRDDEMLGCEASLAGVGADGRGLAVDDGRRAKEGAHLGPLQERADAACEPRDDRILPGDGAGEIELWRPD
jgi:hypothetical protein